MTIINLKKILLARPRGFCAGVDYAIEIVNQVRDLFSSEYNIFILNEIVHNKGIVAEYESQGIKSVKSIEEVIYPPAPLAGGANKNKNILIFSAHGVPPEYHEIAKSHGIITIDATCPLVRKVHLEARRFANDGYFIVYIGHTGHEEAVGVLAECPDQIILVNNLQEAQNLIIPEKYSGCKLAYLTQTTLSVDETGEIINYLETQYPDIQGPAKEDICYATTNRQKAVKELAVNCDLVIVLGSQNSSNSQRLKESAIKLGTPAYLIDKPAQINPDWLDNIQTVGITAGASAPESIVQETIKYIQDLAINNIEVCELATVIENTKFTLPKLDKNTIK